MGKQGPPWLTATAEPNAKGLGARQKVRPDQVGLLTISPLIVAGISCISYPAEADDHTPIVIQPGTPSSVFTFECASPPPPEPYDRDSTEVKLGKRCRMDSLLGKRCRVDSLLELVMARETKHPRIEEGAMKGEKAEIVATKAKPTMKVSRRAKQGCGPKKRSS